MLDLDHKEGWAPKNWCFWIVVLEKTLESPWESKEKKPINPKGDQPWIFIGRSDAEAPILCRLMQRADSLEKTLMLGKIEGKGRRRWQRMRWLLASPTQSMWVKQTQGDSKRQRSLACCRPWDFRIRHNLATEQQQQLKNNLKNDFWIWKILNDHL